MRSTASRGRTIPLGILAMKPRFDRAGMRFQTFGASECSDGIGQTAKTGSAQFLDGNHFKKIHDGQPAADACSSARGQHVIRSRSIIARRLRAEGADEDAAGIAYFLEKRAVG